MWFCLMYSNSGIIVLVTKLLGANSVSWLGYCFKNHLCESLQADTAVNHSCQANKVMCSMIILDHSTIVLIACSAIPFWWCALELIKYFFGCACVIASKILYFWALHCVCDNVWLYGQIRKSLVPIPPLPSGSCLYTEILGGVCIFCHFPGQLQ